MSCIRRHFNYGIRYLTPKPLGKFKLAGDTVDVVTSTDDFKRIRFSGFIDSSSVPADAKRVKIINVSGFSHTESELGPWIDYGRNAVMLGCYLNGQVCMVLEQGLPVAWCELVPRN